MSIIIIGASGFLGGKLYSTFKKLQPKKDIIGTYMNKSIDGMMPLDITDESSFNKLLEKLPSPAELVIHTAALSNVDYCELHQEEAWKINVLGTQNVTKKFGCPIIFVSTDFVFNGKRGNYSEDDTPNPINHYARTKLEGEKIIRENCPKHIIIRVAVLYGKSDVKKNFISWVIKELGAGRSISVVTDQVVSPTLIDDIALGMHTLVKKKKQGTFHLCGSQALSRYEMALSIAEAFDLDNELITPIISSELRQAAKRPADSSMSIKKIERLGIKMSSFHDGIRRMKEQMKA